MITFTPFPELEAVLDRVGPLTNRLQLSMDLCAANTVCPLDGEALLAFPDLDFFHDIAGIHRHLNRETGELNDCFQPRCARRTT